MTVFIKLRNYYSTVIKEGDWKLVKPLGKEDQTRCGGDWGGAYRKDNLKFKLHACGFGNEGADVSIAFDFHDDLTPEEFFGREFITNLAR